MGFSRSHAGALVAGLAHQNAEIAARFSGDNPNMPPLLVFPATGPELDALDECGVQAVVRHARTLREDGYDTVIAAPIASAKALKRVIDQATQYQPSVLLFVWALDKISIRLGNESGINHASKTRPSFANAREAKKATPFFRQIF